MALLATSAIQLRKQVLTTLRCLEGESLGVLDNRCSVLAIPPATLVSRIPDGHPGIRPAYPTTLVLPGGAETLTLPPHLTVPSMPFTSCPLPAFVPLRNKLMLVKTRSPQTTPNRRSLCSIPSPTKRQDSTSSFLKSSKCRGNHPRTR